MMRDEVQDAARRQPFQPFRVTLTTGATYEVRHPDLIMVGLGSAIIGIPREPDGRAYQHTIQVDLAHVVAIENLQVAQATSNGPSA